MKFSDLKITINGKNCQPSTVAMIYIAIKSKAIGVNACPKVFQGFTNVELQEQAVRLDYLLTNQINED